MFGHLIHSFSAALDYAMIEGLKGQIHKVAGKVGDKLRGGPPKVLTSAGQSENAHDITRMTQGGGGASAAAVATEPRWVEKLVGVLDKMEAFFKGTPAAPSPAATSLDSFGSRRDMFGGRLGVPNAKVDTSGLNPPGPWSETMRHFRSGKTPPAPPTPRPMPPIPGRTALGEYETPLPPPKPTQNSFLNDSYDFYPTKSSSRASSPKTWASRKKANQGFFGGIGDSVGSMFGAKPGGAISKGIGAVSNAAGTASAGVGQGIEMAGSAIQALGKAALPLVGAFASVATVVVVAGAGILKLATGTEEMVKARMEEYRGIKQWNGALAMTMAAMDRQQLVLGGRYASATGGTAALAGQAGMGLSEELQPIKEAFGTFKNIGIAGIAAVMTGVMRQLSFITTPLRELAGYLEKLLGLKSTEHPMKMVGDLLRNGSRRGFEPRHHKPHRP